MSASFFSANSISTWRKRSATDDEMEEIGGKSSSSLLTISLSGVEARLEGGETILLIIGLHDSQQRD